MAYDKLVDSTKLNTDLESIADAIRTKGNTAAQLEFPDGFTSAINAIQAGGGGGGQLADGLLDGTATEVESNVTKIRDYCLDRCDSVVKVSFPNATVVGRNAFSNCKKLTTVSLPVATTIGNEAFKTCEALADVSLPNVTEISSSMFSYCSALTTVRVPNATSVRDQSFYYCSNLTKVVLPKVTSIAGYAFYGSNKLQTVVLSSDIVCTVQGNPSIKTTAYIYVPKALIDQYKVASGWTSYANQFRAIEDYPGIASI